MINQRSDRDKVTAAGVQERKIIHVDMDAFFASVEQRDNPELRGKPVAVGRAKARGVVAAASYEARVFGVRSAMPSVVAMRKCPDLIFAPPRFDVYREVSSQIHSVFARYTDLIEPLSLDEAYLDVTALCETGIPATQIAQEIRAGILEITGLTASAGVSYNKFLAKLASDQNKPDGMTVIPPHKGLEFVASLPVGRFNGVGPVKEARMKDLGILTGADLRGCELPFLAAHFGSSAQHYHDIARGIDPRLVRPNRERKSVGAETTFETDIVDLAPAREALQPLAEKVAARCADKGVAGQTVTLKVKYADFEQITRQRSLNAPVDTAEDMVLVAAQLLAELHPFAKGIRLLGVSVSGLTAQADVQPAQMDLFN